MRIFFVQAGLGAGGAEKVMTIIVGHRAARGDEVHLVALSVPEDGSYHSVAAGVSVHSPQKGDAENSAMPVQLRRLLHIRRALKEVRPDVVVSFLTKVNVLTILAATGLGIPVIVSERNNLQLQMRRFWRVVAPVVMRRARAIVMPTDRARLTLPAAVRNRATVIPNPCEPYPGITVNRGSSGHRLVAVGRLDRQKGFDMLLDTLALVRSRVPEVHLTIFGEGPERANLEARVRALGLESAVSLPGNSRVPGAWMEDADIVVVSSRYEGFSNVTAEAIVSGLPIVSFDCDFGPREMIRHGENGLIVPPQDVPALAQAVADLIEDGALRDRMSATAPESRRRLAPAAILAAWDEVIDSAARRSLSLTKGPTARALRRADRSL